MSGLNLFEIVYYSTEKFKYVDEFFNTKEEIFKYLSSINYKGDKITGIVNKIETSLLQEVDIIDLRSDETKDEEVTKILNVIDIKDEDTKVTLSVNLPSVYDVVIKGNRIACTILEKISVGTDTKFTLRDRFRAYNSESFSLAFKKDNESFCLGVLPSSRGLKGSAQAVIKILNNNRLIIDDLSKYMDVSVLTDGMTP